MARGWSRVRTAVTRAALVATVAAGLLGGAIIQGRPANADPATIQSSFRGDCRTLPTGSICIEFEDGYVWLVQDAITGWGANHGTVQIAYGQRAEYAHALGTEMVWVLPAER